MKKAIALLLTLLMALSVFCVAQAADEGFVDGRFTETRHISVEIYDRSNDGGSDPANNKFTDFIKQKMLEKYNVEVEFQKVPRWTETDVLNNLLAANDAPDVCVTYSYPTIVTYADMGGVLNLYPYIQEYREYLDDLFDLVGDECVYHDKDPVLDQLWAIEARQFNIAGQTTFVRHDWLDKLGLDAPTTLDEFTDMLRAFRDNAEELLGEDAANIIPFLVTSDAGWYIIEIAKNFIPDDVTDKEWYVYGYDDRGVMREGFKDAVRVVNGWYNEGLVWQDFALYATNDTIIGNKIKAGYVGSYIQNIDEPYRSGEEGYQFNIQKTYGEDAGYWPIATFENEKGVYKKFFGIPVDRKVFFPATNDEPLASLLYVNFISSLEARKYLQTGDEGVNHQVLEDGTIQILNAVGPDIVNSLYNIDYTITNNGLNLGDQELTAKTLALGYAGVDSKYIIAAYDLSAYDIRYFPAFNCGDIAAEQGMATVLTEKRNNMLAKAITCSVDDFDEVFDQYMDDYLVTGGQAIIDERMEAWARTYGDVDMLGN